MSPKTVSVFAPAKINLALHITGQRADGYHLLDSLVAFATVGDHLRITPDNALSLTVEGPEAEYVPVDTENLAMQAAALVCDDAGAALTLEKRLPPSSGIGGGSSDAAAAIRGMWELLGKPVTAQWPQASDDRDLPPSKKQIVALGADIPMCLMCNSARVRGVGEIVDPVDLPSLPAVLVNPRISVSTPVIFGELTNKNNPPMPEALPLFPNPGALIDWLSGQRNDLESPAMQFAPVVSWILQELQATKRCGLARMSGSGATCYGLYTDAEAAKIAADQLSQRHPDWWIAECTLGDQSGAARPLVS